jgi:hypothetical protein
MKYFLIPLLVAGAFVYHAAAQAPLGPGAVAISKIEPAGVKTPEYSITGGPQKRSKVQTWLEIEVEFETKPEDIGELKFDYMVAIDKTLVTGSVTHVSIPKGRDHFSVMYIAPRTLEKIIGSGKTLTAANIGNVWITISTPDGVKLVEKGYPKDAPPPNAARMAGLLNKQETPFAPLFFDRYEAVKAKGGGQ